MGTPKLFLGFVVFLSLSGLLDAASTKRTKRSAFDTISPILIENIKPFPQFAFQGDKIFIQKIDRANKQTTYTLAGEDAPAYTRASVDSLKEFVVLTPEEDKIPFKKMKRLYIVLRLKGGSNYAAGLAFIRDAGPNDKDKFSFEGKDRAIEWGFYEEHLIQGRTTLNLVTAVCTMSMLANCLFNATVLVPEDKYIKAAPFKPKTAPKVAKQEVENLPLKTGDGSDSEENYDLFYDLEISATEGRGFGDILGGIATNGLIPGILSGASGLLCTGMAILGWCGTGQGQTDVQVINESGMPLDPAMLQQLMGRRKRGTSTTPVDYPGWKTQYIKATKGVTLKVEEDGPFFGFGNCPYKKADEGLLKSSNSQDIVTFYRTVLRTYCIPTTEHVIDAHIREKVLTISADKGIEVNYGHKFFSEPKNTIGDNIIVSGSVAFASFSQVYQKRKDDKATTFTAPDGKRKISKSISIFGDVVRSFLKAIRANARKHVVTMSRVAHHNINSIFTKLAQDSQNLETCGDCTEDKEINLNDRIYIAALGLFVKKGVSFVNLEEDLDKAYDTFYKANEDKFEKYVHVYS